MVSTHSRLKAAGTKVGAVLDKLLSVSTHSRLKAAGMVQVRRDYDSYRFNTQPPEGGWPSESGSLGRAGWVSTHSRLKAAGSASSSFVGLLTVSTHSRLKAAGP